jgi:predicted transglutaminase-like cysteine proteinase
MKSSIVAVAVAVGFAGGWGVNGWRLEAEFAKAQVAAVEEYERITNEQRTEWEAQYKKDQKEQAVLNERLQKLNRINKKLNEKIQVAQLSKQQANITDLGECPTNEEIENAVLRHNPFGPDFVRMWNEATGSIDAGSDSPD